MLSLDYINHRLDYDHVEVHVSVDGLSGPRTCSSPAVMQALDALRDACCLELSGDIIEGEAVATVTKRPLRVSEPVEVTAEPAPQPVSLSPIEPADAKAE